MFVITTQSAALNGRSAAHELGHILQITEFHQDVWAFDYGLNGSGWSRLTPEYESAAVMEGWADFVAAVSWWDDNNTSSSPVIANLNMEAAQPIATSSCGANSGIPFQSAKGLWDLVDAANEAAQAPSSWADSFNTTPRALSDGWDRFANGTSNRKDQESDPDGVNLRDYFHNNSSVFGTGFFTTLLNHNCTGTQDDG